MQRTFLLGLLGLLLSGCAARPGEMGTHGRAQRLLPPTSAEGVWTSSPRYLANRWHLELRPDRTLHLSGPGFEEPGSFDAEGAQGWGRLASGRGVQWNLDPARQNLTLKISDDPIPVRMIRAGF